MTRRPPPDRPPRIVAVPRPTGPPRLVTRLDEFDARVFRRAVAPLTPRIERSLGDGVYANRVIGRGRLLTTSLEPWRRAWGRWRRSALLDLSATSVTLRADVAQFYPSVGDRVLRRALGSDVEGVLQVLGALWDAGVVGLPVGPDPSAALANAVLAGIDERIAEAGGAPIRWVDDWLIRASDRRAAGRILLVLDRELGSLGLALNPAKTAILDPGELRHLFAPNGSEAPGSGRAMMPAP